MSTDKNIIIRENQSNDFLENKPQKTDTEMQRERRINRIFQNMSYDFWSTFKKYENCSEGFQDFFQPLHGIITLWHSLKILCAFEWKSTGLEFLQGLLQLITTPLTWFIKIPLRLIITTCSSSCASNNVRSDESD